MHLAHLLLLLVLLLANANPVTSIEDQSAISQTTSQRSLRDEVDAKRVVLSSPKDDDPSGVANAESEERGFLSTAASKLKSVVGKNPGLSSKLGSTRQNSEMAAAVGKMPILSKDPQVAQVSAMMEKNGLKITKDSVNQLRSAAGNDPAKRGVLEAIKGISKKGLAILGGVILELQASAFPSFWYRPLPATRVKAQHSVSKIGSSLLVRPYFDGS
ncbi:hypothetical protein PR002_g18374 [Phytophthora rubi]|uniref:RxLR effector protein n=1 Tax=Phytophthora rubi TaxID=129364 RepID=A0A6A3K4W6_9STRA|nr:hypothetical protein PR002_g18374 [Phytophthora rubi]